MWLQVINKVKVTHQGEGHIKVKEKISKSLLILCSPYCQQAGDLHSAEMHSCWDFKETKGGMQGEECGGGQNMERGWQGQGNTVVDLVAG